MAKDRNFKLASGETWLLRDAGTHVTVIDAVGKIMIHVDDVDSLCDVLRAFRDEVTKPKMTGGEKLYASCQIISGLEWAEWGRLPTSMRDRYLEQASLLGIKDDE